MCSVHKIKDLCTNCIRDCHLECDVTLQEHVLNNRKTCRKVLNDQKETAMRQVENRMEKILAYFKRERESLYTKIDECFEHKMRSIDELFEANPKYLNMRNVHRFFPREFQIHFDDVIFEHGVRITSTQDILSLEFDKERFEDKLISDCLDFMFIERITFLNDFRNEQSIFVQFFQRGISDKGFVIKNLKTENIKLLEDTLSIFPFIRSVIFSNFQFNPESESFLLEVGKSGRHLKKITFLNCILSLNPSALESALYNSKLEYFSLNNSKCSSPCTAGELFNSVKNSTSSITTIILVKCGLTKTDCKLIGSVIDKCCSLEKIDLQGNDKMEDGFRYICSRLKRFANCLQYINFSNCNLTDKHLVVSLLQSCKSLKKVFLENNDEIKSSIEEFEKHLPKNSGKEIIF